MENMQLPYVRASLSAINVLLRFHGQLSNEEDPPEGTPQVAADAPPPYSSLSVDSDGETPPHPHFIYVLFRRGGFLLTWQYVKVHSRAELDIEAQTKRVLSSCCSQR